MEKDELIWQYGSLKESVGYTWFEIAERINKELGLSHDESAYRKRYKQLLNRKLEDEDFSESDVKEESEAEAPSSTISQFQLEKLEWEKERKKLQTEKLELNRWLRENARDELIVEQIVDAIKGLSPIEVPQVVDVYDGKRSYLVVISDIHYGIEFVVKDVFGNVINEYSPEIFEKRMWNLLAQLITKIEREGISELHLWGLGDETNGILRLNSQLLQLRYGIVDGTMKYAEFMAAWLNALSKHVQIKFQMVKNGNHDQLRLLSQPKNSFPDENMSKITWWYLKERLKENPNITFLEYENGVTWASLSTYSIYGIHGEEKNLETAIDKICRSQGIDIDYLIGGHRHHIRSAEVGSQSEVLSVRSIIGVDPYGMSLHRASDAGAVMFTFEQGKGLICEDRFVLN